MLPASPVKKNIDGRQHRISDTGENGLSDQLLRFAASDAAKDSREVISLNEATPSFTMVPCEPLCGAAFLIGPELNQDSANDLNAPNGFSGPRLCEARPKSGEFRLPDRAWKYI